MTINLSLINILLAEDDPDDVFIFKEALEEISAHFQLRHVANGEHLMVLLNEAIPDILFLDIRMPCKDGIACIEEIRNDSRFNQLPVIMYTSLEPRYYKESTYRKSANFYIQKTGSITKLVTKLKYILSLDWEKQIIYPLAAQYVV